MTQAFPRRGRHGALCTVILLGPLGLTACSSNGKQEGPQMIPAESVTLLYDFYAETVAHFGREGWDPVPEDATYLGVAPEECPLRSGQQGVRYSDMFLGPPSADPDASAQAMADYWSSLGMETHVIHPSNPRNDRIRAKGDDDRIGVEYIVNTDHSSLTLVTTCVSGDWNAIVDDVIAHRKTQSATPTPAPNAE